MSASGSALSRTPMAPRALAEALRAARAGLDALIAVLPGDQWIGPCAPTLNPPLWELGHIAWFQEHWCLRVKPGVDPHASPLMEPLAPSRARWADWLYDSSRIPHSARWHAPLLSPAETRAYAADVLAAVTDRIMRSEPSAELAYCAELSLYHEHMHTEAWWMAWQAHGYAPPHVPPLAAPAEGAALRIPAGRVELGAREGGGFAFDNEKWAHEVAHEAFEIDARPVTHAGFARFVDDGGYAHPSLWSQAGRTWLAASRAAHPLYWRRSESAWTVRRFDRWIVPPVDEPVIHVNRFEAEAYAAWMGRALPGAAQWVRACAEPGFTLGRCWEWTSDAFAPYPGFAPDPYTDYSLPWFGTHAELRGAGSFVTAPALARPGFRNFYTPERCDPFVGFRTAICPG